MHAKSLIERYRFLFLFIVMIMFFLFKALSLDIQNANLGLYVFLFTIIYSLYVIGHEKRFLIASLAIIGVIEIVFSLSDAFIESDVLLPFIMLFAVLFFVLMTYACILYTLKDTKITITTLFGSLCAYLFIGLSFSYIYQLIMVVSPEAFVGVSHTSKNLDFEFIYYSFVTLTTLGFGDIVPVGAFAKTISWMEAYFGQAYLTILMAMLVGRYVSTNKDKKEST